MSLTNQEILDDFQKLINHKVAKRELVEPELYNALGLLRDFMHPIEGSGSESNDPLRKSVQDCITKPDDLVTDLRNDCKVLIDRTEFQTLLLEIISDTDCTGTLDSYISQLNIKTHGDKQSFVSGMVYASLLTSKLPEFVFRQIDIRKR